VEARDPRPYISVAIPAYNEIEGLPELYRRVESTMAELAVDWEMVVSDNASTDGTREYLRELAARDRRVRVLLMSRNFGHSNAHQAVLEHSDGEWTVLMDADLQDEPEAIPRLLDKAAEGYDVVYAVRAKRPEGLAMRLATAGFYRLVGTISNVKQPPNAGPFSLMRRRVVEELRALPESHAFFPGLRAFVGFRQTGLPLERPPRAGRKPRLGLRRRIAHALDGIIAFSNVPLRMASWLGFGVALLAGMLEFFFLYFKLFTNVEVEGFYALITAILFLGGVQMFTLGVFGQYLGRVYDEVKGRPRYIVAERLNFPREATPAAVDSSVEPEPLEAASRRAG
jgi:glycosyltransferase involved in cell wall biosynthesis